MGNKGDRYVTREHRSLFGERYHVTTREKTAAEEAEDIGKGIGTAVGIAGVLIGGAVARHQANKDRQLQDTVIKARNAINDGDYDTGLALAQQLKKERDKEALMGGYYIAGVALRFMDRHDEAIQNLSEALQHIQALGMENDSEQVHMDMHMHRGWCYLAKGDIAGSIRDFTACVQIEPRQDTGYFCRGIALRRLGDYEEALINFNEAVRINPGDAANYRERGTLYTKMQKTDKALADYSRAITLDPKSPYGYKLRGMLHAFLTGDHAKAVADFSEAIALRQSDAELRELRAASYKELGQSDQAEDDDREVESLGYVRKAYNAYLDTAQTLYQQGMTTLYTQEDTQPKTNFKLIAVGVSIILLTLVSMMCVTLMYGAMPSAATTACGSLILLGILFGIVSIVQAFNVPRVKAKNAVAFISKLAEYNQEKPAFDRFFEKYLTARKSGTLDDLDEQTLPMFQPNGEAWSYIENAR